MKILLISLHPDDETLGCGGTILKHKDMGDKIYWLIITNIDAKNGWDKDIIKKRQKEIETLVKMYSFEKIFKLDIRDIFRKMKLILSIILLQIYF